MTFERRVSQCWLNDCLHQEDYINLFKSKDSCCGPRMDINTSYALYLIKQGKLKQVFDLIFHLHYCEEQIKFEDLYHILFSVVDYLRTVERDRLQLHKRLDQFSCPLCYSVLCEPLTQPCGHTFCRKCFIKDTPKTCKLCQFKLQPIAVSDMQTNILVSTLVQKFWSNEVKGAELRTSGNLKYLEQKYDEALEMYSQAIEYAPNDHINYGNRSQVLHCLGRSEDALADADTAINTCSQWAEGHFRKAKALVSLGRHDEAIISYLVCSVLEESSTLDTIVEELYNNLNNYFMKLSSTYRYNLQSHTLKINRPRSRKKSVEIAHLQLSDGEFTSDDEYEELFGNFSNKSTAQSWSFLSSYSDIGHNRGQKRKISEIISTNDVTQIQENGILHRLIDKFQQELESVKRNICRENRPVNTNNLDKNDFECPLCFQFLHEPVTTPCGHTFCRSCLDRCLDHSPCCPLCKNSLKDYLAKRRVSITRFLEVGLQSLLPQEHKERCQQHQQDLEELVQAGKDNKYQIPIFVATLAIPNIACPLHVFEPKYKLMIRRCMEAGTREFGMCMPEPSSLNGYSDYGTMLEIRDIEYTPDGRAVVNTIGSRRFHAVNKTLKDGYDTANVEFLKDSSIPPDKLSLFQGVHNSVREKASLWYSSLSCHQRRKIESFHCTMPEVETNYYELPNGPAWLWWTIAILPIGANIQCKILQKTSLLTRLKLVEEILICLSTKNNMAEV